MKNNLLPITFVIGLGLGGAGTYFYHQQKDHNVSTSIALQKDFDRFYDNFFNKDYFSGKSSPFEQMEKMRKEMDKLSFDEWYEGKFGGDLSEIKQTEDSKNVYYRISLKGLDKNSLRVDVVNGQLNIFGEKNEVQAQEDPDRNAVSKSEFHQSFQRSFPVPENVDETKVKIKTEGDEVVVQFPKIRDRNLI